QIMRRDGLISPLGGAIDSSAPEYLQHTNIERVADLEAAHIVPFMLSKYSTMRNLLSMFAGSNLQSRLVGRSINGPSNIFCTDPITHTLFDKFIIGVEYVNQQYKLRKVVTRKAGGPFIARAQDGE
ncbi:uncharacterized protein V1513DRAFT_359202, partial [Lipomyces chichibuensis]|uniref:uncharacterized protein n=1 Tax=Lipomyces chichibuensis TaxID=1546026 RepID=UPI0033442771